jgi:hypothetical protein
MWVPLMQFCNKCSCEAHFDAGSLEIMLSNNVIPMFLQSQSSVVSQPNDNKPNAFLEKKITARFAEWRRRFPVVLFKPSHFNAIF